MKLSMATVSVEARIIPRSLRSPAEGPLPSIPVTPSTIFKPGFESANISTTSSAKLDDFGVFL